MSATPQPQRTSLAGRVLLTLFFAVFAGFGCLFLFLLTRDVLKKHATRSWTSTPCTVLSAQVRSDTTHDDLPYQLQIRYRFPWQDSNLVSTQVNLSGGRFKDLAQADRLLHQLPVGGAATCYVNPSNPSESVLVHESRGILFAAPLPLLFALIGIGGIIGAWKIKDGTRATNFTPLSTTPQARNSQKIAIGFFVVFTLFSSIFLAVFTLRPITRVILAQQWLEVPCRIESGQLRRHQGDKGSTYSIDIVYRYEINGTEHRGNQYDFMGGSSSGYEGKQKILAQYPPGKQTICFVHPSEASESVLNRGITPTFWIGLIPLIFVGAGMLGIRHSLQQSRRQEAATTWNSTSSTTPHNSSPATLKPIQSRVGMAVGMFFFSLIWNGVISVFLYQIVKGFRNGSPEWFLVLFMIPFVLVGLATIALVIHQIAALFNPTISVTLNPGELQTGQTATLQWNITGRTHRIQRLQICLEAHESATYRRGTDTPTATSLFHQTLILDTSSPTEMQHGEARIQLPAITAYSLELPNNKISWRIQVLGRIDRWADIDDSFLCKVIPSTLPAATSPLPSPTPESSTQPTEEKSADGSVRIGLKEGRRHFRPGETLHGAVGWSLSTIPRSAEVRLFYFTRGRGTTDVAQVQTIPLDNPQANEVRPFSFQLPEHPVTLDGALISIVWAVEVILQPGNVHARYEFTLSPTDPPLKLSEVPNLLQTRTKRWFHAPSSRT